MLSPRSRKLPIIFTTALVATAISTVAIQLGENKESAAAGPLRDGTTAMRAGASCWGIKQAVPAAQSGVFWIQTPRLIAPRQVYCDMVTDGGGWTLIGRGRENWNFTPVGQGDATAIATVPDGVGAFSPATYSEEVVDGILNGARPDQLADGVRLRRATNTAGSVFQEMRWQIQGPGNLQGRDRWTWAFNGGVALSNVIIDGVTYGATNSIATSWTLPGQNTPALQLWGTNSWYTADYNMSNRQGGFAFEGGVGGSTAPTSFIYQHSHAVPFTQVWVRPELPNSLAYPQISNSGTSQSTVRALLKGRPEATPWGVATYSDPANQYPNTLVQAFVRFGANIYVGGEFLHVRQGSNGPLQVQSYLAAFNASTGAWVPSFNPVFNGSVYDLAMTSDGKLLAAGSFTSVNGAVRKGLVALDPNSGATNAAWTGRVDRVQSTIPAIVTSIDLKAGWIYAGGQFTHAEGGPNNTRFPAVNLARFALGDGKPDSSWTPKVNWDGHHNNVADISASTSSDALWIAGWFSQVNSQPARNIAAVSMVNGARVDPAGMPTWHTSQPYSPTSWVYQWTIREIGSSVWNAGSQHNIDKHARSDFAHERTTLANIGGDFQYMTHHDGTVYAGCHCTTVMYQDARDWVWPTTTFGPVTQIEKVNSFAAWDPTTGDYLRDFYPQIYTTAGGGPWEFYSDSNCMWVGGDFNAGPFVNGVRQWIGGFAKFCNRDTQAPTIPQNGGVSVNGSTATLTWSPSTDNQGTVAYEVLRDDRVIATVSTTTFADTDFYTGARYFIRAIDPTGNRSASTSVLGGGGGGGASLNYVPAAAPGWRYMVDGSNQGTDYRLPATSLASWQSGTAPIGKSLGETTTIQSVGTTQYFAHDFTVNNLNDLASLQLKIKVDDGAVVYVNGVELARTNMPFGAPNFQTTAWAAQTGQPSWKTYNAPKSALVAGTNRIAVEVHQAAANDVDIFMDGSITGIAPSSDNQAPSMPTLSAPSATSTSINLAWTASTDNVAVAGYILSRPGVQRILQSGTLTYSDQLLTPGTSYTYTIRAFDANGNLSPASTITKSTL